MLTSVLTLFSLVLVLNPHLNNVSAQDTQLSEESYQFVKEWGSEGKGNGQFNGPITIAIDSSDNVYIIDSSNNRIQKFDSNGFFITKWGSYGSIWENGEAKNGQFNGPVGIAIDSSDNVYIADSGNNRIQKFDSSGTFITKWGSDGTAKGQFFSIIDIAIDSSDNVYTTDHIPIIQKFDSNGSFESYWNTSHFGEPFDIAIDSSDNVYVSYWDTHLIQKFDTNGTEMDTIEYPIKNNESFKIQTIAIDKDDNLLITSMEEYLKNSTYNYYNSIHKIDVNGVYIGDIKIEDPTQLDSLSTWEVAFNSKGDLYIIDGENIVRMYSPKANENPSSQLQVGITDQV